MNLLASAGIARRAMDDRVLFDEEQARRKANDQRVAEQHAAQLDTLGLQRRAAKMQIDEQERVLARRDSYEKSFRDVAPGSGLEGTAEAMAEAARQQGDFASYKQWTDYQKQARDEGLQEVIRHVLTTIEQGEMDDDPVSRDITNKHGKGRTSRVSRRAVRDKDGNVEDIEVIAHTEDGRAVPVRVMRHARLLGMLPKEEWSHDPKSGALTEKFTGRQRQGLSEPQKAGDYLLKVGIGDGKEAVIDTRDPKSLATFKATQAGDISSKDADAIWDGMLKGKGAFDSLEPEQQRAVAQGFIQGVGLLRQGALDPSGNPLMPQAAGYYGLEIHQGRMTPDGYELNEKGERVARRFTLGKTSGPAGGGRPQGVPDGAQLLPTPDGKQAWHWQQNGKWYRMDETPAAGTHGEARKADRGVNIAPDVAATAERNAKASQATREADQIDQARGKEDLGGKAADRLGRAGEALKKLIPETTRADPALVRKYQEEGAPAIQRKSPTAPARGAQTTGIVNTPPAPYETAEPVEQEAVQRRSQPAPIQRKPAPVAKPEARAKVDAISQEIDALQKEFMNTPPRNTERRFAITKKIRELHAQRRALSRAQ